MSCARILLASMTGLWLLGATAAGQSSSSAPASQPGALLFKVIELQGDVRHAAPGSRDFQVTKLGDQLGQGVRVLTGVRSAVKFQVGEQEPYTCLMVDAAGLIEISESLLTSDTKKVRVSLAHGRVRAGVAEGGLKSDFTVDCPVATLSKKGTWGFSLFYERDSDVFEIGLTDRGLVEALRVQSGQRRELRPGEYVTQAMRLWLDQSRFDSSTVVDALGQADMLIAFNRVQTDGLGVTRVGDGRVATISLVSDAARNDFRQLLENALQFNPAVNRIAGRPEGAFGTGRGEELLELLVEPANGLVQRGDGRAGRFLLRRDAAESWLRRGTRKP